MEMKQVMRQPNKEQKIRKKIAGNKDAVPGAVTKTEIDNAIRH